MTHIFESIIKAIKANKELSIITWFYMSVLATAMWIFVAIENYSRATIDHKLALINTIILLSLYSVCLFVEINKRAAKTKVKPNTNPSLTHIFKNMHNRCTTVIKRIEEEAKSDNPRIYDSSIAKTHKEILQQSIDFAETVDESFKPEYIKEYFRDFYIYFSTDNIIKYKQAIASIDAAEKIYKEMIK